MSSSESFLDPVTLSKMEISFNSNEILGQGYHGTIYKGSWRDNPVAVKKIEIAKFTSDEQENKILQELNHENVIKIFHTESDEDFKYYALELCEASLDKLFLKDGDPKIYMGPIPPPEDVLLQIATGLEYIHRMGFVHRDVKPQNILISSTKDTVLMKWADFGLSKAVNKTGSYEMVKVEGTKKWLAPELLKIINQSSMTGTTSLGHKRSKESDVFAEGSVFAYFLSDGKHPFGSTNLEISEKVLKNNPVNVTKTNIPSKKALHLIRKMLEVKPEKRINSSKVVQELKKIKGQLKTDLKMVDSMTPSVNMKNRNDYLGKGGFTIGVYKGVWRHQRVAIKIINLGDSLSKKREKILQRLDHPNIIKLYHIEKNDIFRYFALELCVASLDQLFLKDDAKKNYDRPKLQDMPPPQFVFSQLADGMAYIHNSGGIAHRDIKPANILIHRKIKLNQTPQLVMKWADFGTSKKVNAEGKFSMSSEKFTRYWCATEVLQIYLDGKSSQSDRTRKPVGTIQSDVFSEGMVFLYYLLDGKHPYGTEVDILSNLLKNNPTKLHKISEEHPLKELITEMLNTEPNKRPTSEQVAEKLKSLTFTVQEPAEPVSTISSISSIKTKTIQIDRKNVIGRGTFGMVFKGNYGDVGIVAVKRIQLAEIYIDQGESEIMNLNHENIVKLYHVEDDDNFKYIVMELCDATLDQLFLHDKNPRKYNGPKPNCFEVMYQLALGLEYIHSKKLLYRDIKPENVLISVDKTNGKKLTMKWADFGFTRPKSEQGSFSSSMTRSCHDWMAPELIRIEEERRPSNSTQKSDVFAQGLLFGFFLSEGRHPFGSPFEIWGNILDNKIKIINDIKSEFCRDLILKMLNPDPVDRIASSGVVELIESHQQTMEKPLLELLEKTPPNLNDIENLISEGANINSVNEHGLTPLLHLIQKEKSDLLQVIPFLIDLGIDLNHKDEEGWNVLCFLCYQYQQKLSWIDYLVTLLRQMNLFSPSPKNNLVEIIRFLINRGVDTDWKNSQNKNILHFYCRHYKGENFIDIVNVFMESGVKVVSEGEDARRLIKNPKYPNRPNADEIIELMNKNC